MPTVFSPTGRPIYCRDEAEAERVRAWAAWVHLCRAQRSYESRQRWLEEQRRATQIPRPQDYITYRESAVTP